MSTVGEYVVLKERWNALEQAMKLDPLQPLVAAMDKTAKDHPLPHEDGHPDAPVGGMFKGDIHNPAMLGSWAMDQPKVTQYLAPYEPMGYGNIKKINAIKELRALSYAGLKESKAAVEWMLTTHYGHPPITYKF